MVGIDIEETRICAGERVRLWSKDAVHGKRIIPESVRFRDQIREAGLMDGRCRIRRSDISKRG